MGTGISFSEDDLREYLQKIWLNPLDPLDIIECDSDEDMIEDEDTDIFLEEENIVPEVKEVWDWETYVSIDVPLPNGRTVKLEAQRFVKKEIEV